MNADMILRFGEKPGDSSDLVMIYDGKCTVVDWDKYSKHHDNEVRWNIIHTLKLYCGEVELSYIVDRLDDLELCLFEDAIGYIDVLEGEGIIETRDVGYDTIVRLIK